MKEIDLESEHQVEIRLPGGRRLYVSEAVDGAVAVYSRHTINLRPLSRIAILIRLEVEEV